jgi:cytochrome c biogenesis protein CcmG/thiol:disulfide interchange protein DsbE
LETLARLPGVAVYGLTQKDKPAATRAFLDEVGNPFARIARDDDGRASIEWGVYGVPETYVVDGRGIVRLKYVGPLSDDVLAQQLVPAIKAAQQNP